jgi:hypothetical protein
VSLFRRRNKDEAHLANVIATRGIPGTGVLRAMQPTGRTKDGGATREFDFRVAFTPHYRTTMEVAVRQFISELNATGLAPGEPVSVLYDREDPTVAVVVGSPNYRILGAGVAVRVEGKASGEAREAGWT